MSGKVTVVVATRDRRPGLLRTLTHLHALPERPPVIVVDNGSGDGSAAAVREAFPMVDVVALGRNLGATARNIGVRRAATPYVAFADDDSWWAPGSLRRAAAHFDRCPRLGLLAARILVGPEERVDPTSARMADSPLGRAPDLPGPSVLGFLACGGIVRRDAFVAVGGFDDLLFFFGEEALLTMDLAAAGWGPAYADDVVAHHHPAPPADPDGRRCRQLRNDLLTTWMRRPAAVAAGRTARVASLALREPPARRALAEATVRLPVAVSRRRPTPASVEAALRRLE
ncbi:MAG: glycosyl transferase family 2 [Acidimicrobiales bacterium]|jgi:GT2 family glycosyltransferase|nr:glycosyl transferase family 2 [Acidimicrobiales bacterium]